MQGHLVVHRRDGSSDFLAGIVILLVTSLFKIHAPGPLGCLDHLVSLNTLLEIVEFLFILILKPNLRLSCEGGKSSLFFWLAGHSGLIFKLVK